MSVVGFGIWAFTRFAINGGSDSWSFDIEIPPGVPGKQVVEARAALASYESNQDGGTGAIAFAGISSYTTSFPASETVDIGAGWPHGVAPVIFEKNVERVTFSHGIMADNWCQFAVGFQLYIWEFQ